MNQTFIVNLIWGLIPFLGIIIGIALWLNNRCNRIANASIHSLDLAKEVETISADKFPMSESDSDRDRPIVIEETTDDDDAEPPFMVWFF